MRKTRALALASAIACLLLMPALMSGALAAKLPRGPISSDELKEIKKPPGARLPGCSDLRATLTVHRKVVGDRGIIDLHGTICNGGTMDYNSGVGALAELRGTDPATRRVVLQSKRLFYRLARGGCIDIIKSYTIEEFIAWDLTTPASGQCAGQTDFELSVVPGAPQVRSFPREEDCRSDNNSVRQSVKFMYRCP
jgi:hypothetical protein